MADIDKSRYAFIPRKGAVPFVVERAEGAYLYTTDGRTILDAAGGAIVANVGHGRREVADAMADAVAREGYVVPGFATPSRLELARRLQDDWLPEGLDHLYLASGGSEAVDAAIRLARQHHVAAGRRERNIIIGRENSYHGTTLAGLAAGGHPKRRAPFESMLPDWPKAPACYCLRCPLGRSHPSCRVACADEVERIVLEAGPENVAAVIAEPIVGSTGGAIDPPDDYWPRLAEVCRKHGVLLIADEVMTGFGRTGRRFGVDHFGVVPDILVSGKGLAGGYAPIGGVFATESVVRPMADAGEDLMFYTFGAHTGACAAASAVLDILQREKLVARAAEMGARLRGRLAGLAAHPHVAEIRGRGLMIGIELVRDRASLERFDASLNITGRVVANGLREGVFFYPSGAGESRDAVMLGPPFIISDAEIEKMVSALESAIDAATA